MQKMNYTCPVCGYNELELPPADFTICPSCGMEFGYHDATASLEELRQRWIGRGAPWTSQTMPPPLAWNAWVQLWRVTNPERVPDSQVSDTRLVLTLPNHLAAGFFATASNKLAYSAA
jgi:hypothetical protein